MIDVALTPGQLRRSEIAVVIDVLRAASSATQALASGYRRVLLTDTIARAEALRVPGRVLAGERRCVKPPGFDLGNSPRAFRHCHAVELVLATTNGTPTVLAAARYAPKVILACLLNLNAVIEALRTPEGNPQADIQIVCSGTAGAVALEDVYAAGCVSAPLGGARTDAALVAEAVARAHPTPSDALAASADATLLRSAGLERDIADCAEVGTLNVVPGVTEASDAVAALALEPAGGRAPAADAIGQRP